MTDIQAAIGIIQLRRLPFILERRRELAQVYNKALSEIKYIRVPKIPEHIYHNYQSYWIEILDSSPVSRDTFMKRLLEKGIATRRGIMAIHMEECYSNYRVFLPETERITKNTVLLPIYPSMTGEEQGYVIQCINEVLQ